MQWARLKDEENRGLRRGAWYRVIALTEHEAVLDVSRRGVRVPRETVQLATSAPDAWTIVRRPADAKGAVAYWAADKYLVCPSCRHRAALKTVSPSQQCPRCAGLFGIGWDDWFAGPP